MYFATIIKDNTDIPIVLNAERDTYCIIRDVLDYPQSLLHFIWNHTDKDIDLLAHGLSQGKPFSMDNIEFNAPIPYPLRNAFCLGKNYRDHLEEIPMLDGAKNGVISAPIYFTKLAYPIGGHCGKVSRYAQYDGQLDYETELGIIISKKGRDIPREKAKDYIFGYSICNDWSMRNFQVKHSQWFKGKSFDGHLTMGPFIAYRDTIKYPPQLRLQTTVNGEIRQSSNTEKLIFDIDYIISDLSQGLTLHPGDIILTGTCSGVGMGHTPPKYLSVGDRVESSIECLGTLASTIIC